MGATRAAPGPRGARDASRLRCALGPDPCGISIGPGVIPAGFWAEHGEIRLEVATSGGSPAGGRSRLVVLDGGMRTARTPRATKPDGSTSVGWVFFLSRQGKSAMLTCSNEHLPNFMGTLRNSDFF